MYKLYFLFLLICTSIFAEIRVEKPSITISGSYKDKDGRVGFRSFPVIFKLQHKGKFSGTIETWVEARLSDGTSELSFPKNEVSGFWKMQEGTILITVTEENGLMGKLAHKIKFDDFMN